MDQVEQVDQPQKKSYKLNYKSERSVKLDKVLTSGSSGTSGSTSKKEVSNFFFQRLEQVELVVDRIQITQEFFFTLVLVETFSKTVVIGLFNYWIT